MPSDNQRFSYFQNILRDGVTPFHYRNRVRTLLGLPEGDLATVGHHYSPSSVPVGFKYRHQEHIVIGSFGMQEARPKFWLGAKNDEAKLDSTHPNAVPNQNLNHQNNNLRKSPTDSADSNTHNRLLSNKIFRPSDPEEFIGKAHELQPKGQVPSSTKDLAGKDETFAASSKKNPQKIEPTITHRSHIDIPGRSPEKKTFPLLSEGEMNNQVNTQGKEAAALLRQQQLSESRVIPNGSIEQDLTSSSLGMIQRKSANKKTASQSLPTPKTSPETQESSEPLKKSSGLKAKVSKPSFRNDSKNILKVENASNRAMFYQVEKLQHAVQELTAKRNRSRQPEQSKPHPERTAPRPTPPQQPVVVVEQTPRQFRTPDAFWERSHMGRMHLRLLR